MAYHTAAAICCSLRWCAASVRISMSKYTHVVLTLLSCDAGAGPQQNGADAAAALADMQHLQQLHGALPCCQGCLCLP